jgi:branched-chain amino acid transport system permease protein
VFTIVVTGVYGWTIERIAYKPLRNSTRLAPLISAIGMSLILQNYAQLSQGRASKGATMLDGVFACIWAKVSCR